ncbi:MAG: GNAT family N-acetyltransferase [Euryarchaeota archaeon]|nr:GNAT family N-acetyltransferase [Euryarchaeota archaeon]
MKTPFARPFRKRDAEPLLSDYKGRSQIFAAFFGVKEAGLMQVELQEWNNSLRVWDFAVWPKFQRKGVGAALMDKCKELAMGKGARRIVLETQTSNAGAIAFYLSQGFELAGMDATNYRNDDVGRCEVRLELAYHLKARGKKNERAL